MEKVANLLRLRGRLEAPPFSFLNLGLLAYVGQQEALAQVQTGDAIKVSYSFSMHTYMCVFAPIHTL